MDGPSPAVNTKEVKPRSMSQLYEIYFKAMKYQGLLPFDLNLEEGTVNTYKRRWWTAFSIFNFIHITLYCIKPCVLYYINRKSNFEYDTVKGGYIFQMIWILGYFTIYPIFITFLFSVKPIKLLISMWLKLEMQTAEIFPEPEAKFRKRFKLLKLQQSLYAVAWTASFLLLIPIAYIVPRFPPFLNSIYMVHPKKPDYPKQEPHSALLQYIFTTFELHTTIMAWGLLGGFDVLVSMICRSLIRILESLEEEFRKQKTIPRISDQLTQTYLACQLVTTQFNKVFARLLFFQEITNLLLSVFILHGALTGEDPYLSLFCLCNTFPLTLRMYVLYLPMSTLYTKSKRLVEYMRMHCRERKGEMGIEWDQVVVITDQPRAKSFRFIMLKAWFFHKISPTSILDYSFALISYFVTLQQIKNKDHTKLDIVIQ